MNLLPTKQINQLLSIINLYPSIRIMHFSNDSCELNDKIVQLCTKHEYEFQLNYISDVLVENAIDKFDKNSLVHIKKINLQQPRYAIQAKVYDYLFVTMAIEDTLKESFLKKSHAIIKNAGIIIIFVPKIENKRDDTNIYLWMQLLEETYFVASNTIDIFDDYDLVVSKKMHGWGG